MGAGARIEHRVGDGAASPYFAVAAVLQAALLGYENNYSLPDEEKYDGFEQVSSERHVADNLADSIDLLEANTTLTSAIGEELIANYCAIKRAEAEELSEKSSDEVISYYSFYI